MQNKAVINYQYFRCSFGELKLGSYDEKLCLCDWRYRTRRNQIDQRIEKGLNATFLEKNDAVIEYACQQLLEYFAYRRKKFTIPLLLVGTAFQKKVWSRLQEVAFGETLTYLQLAESTANRESVRAVASANGANAISIFVPCHRIVGSTGSLVGYAGGTGTKAKLLSIENDLFI